MSNSLPLFSVVIPCHNHARFLPLAVKSLSMQGYDNMEAIIVNDGSTDDTSSIAQTLVRKKACPNLSYREQDNRGPAIARNNGITSSRGDWIVVLDADDMLAEGFLAATARHILDNPEVDAVSGAYKEFGARESGWILTRYRPERFLERGNILVSAPFKKSLWQAVGGYSPDNAWGAEDWHFWIKCQMRGFVFSAFPSAMLHYRKHESGSRMQARETYEHEFLAMHHSMTPEAYTEECIRQGHAVLLRMSTASEEAIRRKIHQLPELSLPHFWLGLAHEGKGEVDAAQREYSLALRTQWQGDWQAKERLARIAG